MRVSRYFATAVLVGFLWPSPAWCEGWNDVPFGTPLSAFLERNSNAAPAAPTPDRNAAQLPFTSYSVRERSLGPLRSCDLVYSFAGQNRELFRIEARCRAESAEIYRYLTQEFGAPFKATETQLWWRSPGIEVNFFPKAALFTVHDVERSKSVAAGLLHMLGKLELEPVTTPSPAAQGSQ